MTLQKFATTVVLTSTNNDRLNPIQLSAFQPMEGALSFNRKE
jgi:hypothetical protein